MKNTIKVLEYFKAGLSDIETSTGERQPMQDEIDLALIECKNNGALGGVVVRLFDPAKNKPRVSTDDETFSEDVCIIDEDGVHGIAYFCFESDKWGFHTDTLVDYAEIGAETKWKWYYPSVDAEKIEW